MSTKPRKKPLPAAPQCENVADSPRGWEEFLPLKPLFPPRKNPYNVGVNMDRALSEYDQARTRVRVP